jgi:hypothetical protein
MIFNALTKSILNVCWFRHAFLTGTDSDETSHSKFKYCLSCSFVFLTLVLFKYQFICGPNEHLMLFYKMLYATF